MREVRGFSPWSKQADMARALVDDRRVLAYTCNGAGKSTLLAELVLWFMSTRYNARVIMTAGVGAQVQMLWRKIRGAHSTSRKPLPGEPLAQSWSISPEWFCVGTSAEYEETMQGYHSWTDSPDEPQRPGDPGGLLAVMDEASGIQPFAFNAMRGYMTTQNTYWIVMGNPNAAGTPFHEASTKGDWTRFQVSAFDVPENILSRDWIAQQQAFFGEDSPQYQVRVLGQFPDAGGDFQLVPLWMLEASADSYPEEGGLHLGLDVARGGSDLNVAVVTSGNRVVACKSWHESDLMRTVRNVEELAAQYNVPGDHLHIDVTGIGAGVVDRLREKGFGVDAVDFGGKPLDDYQWLLGSDFRAVNRKAELHWAGRNLLQKQLASIPEEYQSTIWKQLQWPSYSINERGAVAIEAKERLRTRYGESPDFADAWIISLSRGVRPRIFVV